MSDVAAGDIILATHNQDHETRIDALEALDFGEAGISNAGTGDSSTSGSYANLAGTSSFSFTKNATTTRVRIDLAATFFSSATTSGAKFGVRIDGVDYDVVQLREVLPTANAHLQVSGFLYIAASVIAAGTYTVQGRWLRTAGAGTISRNGDDWLCISARELV